MTATTRTTVGRAFAEATRELDEAICYIPELGPVSLGEARRWIEESAGRNREVDFRIDAEADRTRIWLKSWPFDGEEPDWPEDWLERES